MVIVWGSGLYGDATLYYLPLFPAGSHFVFEQTSAGWRGVPIGWSFKSILTAWLRVALGLLTLISGIGAVIEFMEQRTIGGIGLSVACVAFIAMFVATKRMRFFTIASYERAKELADQLGLTDQAMVMIDLYYGELTEVEAERKMNEFAEPR
jgi:hypothetical protein